MGVPVPNVMVKLVDVEDMKYFAANNEGEVFSISGIVLLLLL